MAAADEMIDTVYLHTYDDVLFRNYKIKDDSAIILLKKVTVSAISLMGVLILFYLKYVNVKLVYTSWL